MLNFEGNPPSYDPFVSRDDKRPLKAKKIQYSRSESSRHCLTIWSLFALNIFVMYVYLLFAFSKLKIEAVFLILVLTM